jgi:hypothetical protein
MRKLGIREFFALLLCVLISNPPSIVSASSETTPRAVLGSISSRGSVRVGEMSMPTEGTLFSGDRVQTVNGSAVIQYRDGARILLASGSLANFAAGRVQLENGLMSFETGRGSDVVFAASTLRLEPGTEKAAANVTLKDSKASVAVTQGTLRVVDPSGVQLASLKNGDSRLFEEAAAAVPDPAASPSAAPAGPPQGGGSSSGGGSGRKWLLAAGIAVVGLSIGIAGLVRANDAENDASSANASAAAANAQVAGLQTQIASANAQVASLQAQLASLRTTSAQIAAVAADLSKQSAALAQAQATLNALITAIAQQGGTATSAQIAQLQSLTSTINGIISAINADVAAANRAQTCALSPTAPGCP